MSQPLQSLHGHGPDSPGSVSSRLRAAALRHLDRSLKKQWRCCRKELKRCQKKLSDKSVHQTRVAARRVLSILELASAFVPARTTRKLARALKRQLDTFDALRDTQVQLAALGRLRRSFPAAHVFYEHLRRREERLSGSTLRKTRRIKTGKADQLLEEAREALEGAGERVAADTVARLVLTALGSAYARVVEFRSQIDARDTRTIHCTRVAFKKYRYMVEALAEHLPGCGPEMLQDLHDYQTLMGDIQDSEVLLAAFDKFLCKHPVAPAAASRLRDALLGRRQQLIDRYLQGAEQLSQFEPGDPDAAVFFPGRRRSLPSGRKPARTGLRKL